MCQLQSGENVILREFTIITRTMDYQNSSRICVGNSLECLHAHRQLHPIKAVQSHDMHVLPPILREIQRNGSVNSEIGQSFEVPPTFHQVIQGVQYESTQVDHVQNPLNASLESDVIELFSALRRRQQRAERARLPCLLPPSSFGQSSQWLDPRLLKRYYSYKQLQ